MKGVFKSALLIAALLASQEAVSDGYSTQSRKAKKAYENALELFRAREYRSFFEKIDLAIAEDSTFTEAYLLAMQGSVENLYEKKAIHYAEKAFQLNPTLHPPLASILGKLYLRDGQYDKAISCFNFFIEHYPNQRVKVDDYLEKAETAREFKNHPVSINPKNLGDSINTQYDDYWPSISADGQTLVKTTNIPRSDNERILQEDFFVSTKDSLGRWRPMEALAGLINTAANEGAQSLTADGKGMYITMCVNECNIFYSRLVRGQWSLPEKLTEPVNQPAASNKQPSVSADGRYLFFTSNRRGGYGGYDLYVATRDMQTGEWVEVKNLGPTINTPKNDVAPFIHFDGQTLYFASDGRKGLGGLDLFMSRRNEKGEWGTPVNLGYPVNTHGEEQGLIISSDAKTTYIASSREAGRGLDIYSFELPDALKPQVSSYLRGVVVDAKTQVPISAEVVLANLKTGKDEMVSSSDPIDGAFFTSLPAATSYALQVNKRGYLLHSQSFLLDSTKTLQNPLTLRIELQPITVGSTAVLRNIYFEVNSFELKPESNVELGSLIRLLNENPTLWIEISGHTDSSGQPQFNNALSTNRAKEVVKYLISKGIDHNRLRAVGYGSSKPIAPNDSAENKAKNRRTEFKVLYK